ncbi:HNH endonuclease [Deinococcus yavapaiensis]|uniref:HNH endonuclease n=1 Tax=Deinococcus yavapaiensis KR-236 TaxID=694435 RepID=A0A318S788_9DEIO|nr:HNH endonuclease signature motif containing protein [Deinococcus yavapaiensis]PYE51050.1 HNH endonuclease [Deinococcus yavapaiensis KR-236]
MISKPVSLIERRNNRVYCSECVKHARGRKGFYTDDPKAFSPALRTAIRKRDGHACQACGRTQAEAGTLHVHHIDYDKYNNNPMNLIALCRVCHGQTNFGTESWQARLQAQMTARFV